MLEAHKIAKKSRNAALFSAELVRTFGLVTMLFMCIYTGLGQTSSPSNNVQVIESADVKMVSEDGAKKYKLQSIARQRDVIRQVNEALSKDQVGGRKIATNQLAHLAEMMLETVRAPNATPAAWEAASRLIAYRSNYFNGTKMGYKLDTAHPCVAQVPNIFPTDKAMEVTVSYGDCTFDLNDISGFASMPQMSEIQMITQEKPKNFHLWFIGARVTLDPSRPIIDFAELVGYGCIIEIKATKVLPSRDQQLLIRTILANDPGSFDWKRQSVSQSQMNKP